ncbi:MAG: pilus assembly protein PilM [Candidatus Niyogibacteria bacterium]|nr:pilus assembly protein PilM [Candidatus Niyogibacteria bacterium]
MSFWYNIFPPPAYLDFPAVGLDVSDRSVKFVEFAQTRKGLRLKRFGKRELAPGIIVAGEIKKPDEFSSTLASILKPLGITHIVAALPEERAYISMISIPNVSKKQAREVVELELPERIPLPPGETIFDFELIPHSRVAVKDAVISEDDPEHSDALVYAFPRSLVADYLDAYLRAGLTPISFTMETVSLSRALTEAGRPGAPAMIVDFGKTRVSFVIVADGLTRFSSTASVAGEALDQVIAKTMNVSLEEAEQLKKDVGLSKSPESAPVFDAILPIVSAVADEIEKHVLFWNTHAEHVHRSVPQISRIILSGGDANLTGLTEYLSKILKIPVELGNPWVNVAPFDEYIPEIKLNESLTYSAAVGLGLIAALGE